MIFFNFNPFSKKTTDSNDEPNKQMSGRSKEISDAFIHFIKAKHPGVLDEPMLFIVAGCYFAVGASGVDQFRKTMPIKDAVAKAIETVEKQINQIHEKVTQSYAANSVERSLMPVLFVCFASIGAKWAAENPQKSETMEENPQVPSK